MEAKGSVSHRERSLEVAHSGATTVRARRTAVPNRIFMTMVKAVSHFREET
jgi:hypothetical protein